LLRGALPNERTVCNLLVQFAVNLRFKSRRTHDHISLSHLRLRQPWGQVPVFISPRNRVAQLLPRALGSIFVGYYDSQGYGEGILTRLHTGPRTDPKSKSRYDWRSVSMSWCRAPSGPHDQMFITVWRLLFCLCWTPSLTIGLVCHLSVRVCIFKPFVSIYT
jgi:hypothetical protein